MKIGILTYYGVHNHGAVLQANALKSVLKSMGHDVGFLSFNRNYDYISQEQANKYKIGIRSIPFFAKYMFQKGIGNIIYNIKKNNNLNEYRNNHLPCINRYSEFQGDAVIIGSDEVFSIEIGVNPFLFGHGVQANKVFSYAGSFGPTNIEDIRKHHLTKLIESGLMSMDAISVRDGNSKIIAEKLTGKDVTLVCDPVILYGYEKEMLSFTPDDKDYIVVYAYDGKMNDAEEVKHIKAYAKKRGLKLYSVGYHHKWCDKNIIATPDELLGWVKNAEFVLTDTFHGSVISIICNTPMVVKLRGNANKLHFLLNEYGLVNRIIPDFEHLQAVAESSLDFNPVNAIIQERRAASMKFLREAIK